MTSELCFLTAVELSARLRAGEVSACEVMEAHLQQIDVVNGAVNAIVTLVAEQAMDEARALDARGGRDSWGPLAGLPVSSLAGRRF